MSTFGAQGDGITTLQAQGESHIQNPAAWKRGSMEERKYEVRERSIRALMHEAGLNSECQGSTHVTQKLQKGHHSLGQALSIQEQVVPPWHHPASY